MSTGFGADFAKPATVSGALHGDPARGSTEAVEQDASQPEAGARGQRNTLAAFLLSASTRFTMTDRPLLTMSSASRPRDIYWLALGRSSGVASNRLTSSSVVCENSSYHRPTALNGSGVDTHTT